MQTGIQTHGQPSQPLPNMTDSVAMLNDQLKHLLRRAELLRSRACGSYDVVAPKELTKGPNGLQQEIHALFPLVHGIQDALADMERVTHSNDDRLKAAKSDAYEKSNNHYTDTPADAAQRPRF